MTETKTLYQNSGNGKLWHLLSGVIMIILGMYICFNPMVSLLGLALYIGAGLVMIGSGYIIASFPYQSTWFLLVGLFDILVGIVLISNLGVTASSLPIIFALWCMAVGVILVANSWNLKKMELPWIWSLMIGLTGIVFSYAMLAFPKIGAVTITTLLGIYIILYGLFVVAEYTYFTRIKMQ